MAIAFVDIDAERRHLDATKLYPELNEGVEVRKAIPKRREIVAHALGGEIPAKKT